MGEYVKFHVAVRVPIETYRRIEWYARRVGVNVSEASLKLFGQFWHEVPFSVLDSIMDLEGVNENELENLMEALFRYFNKWFDEKYDINIQVAQLLRKSR